MEERQTFFCLDSLIKKKQVVQDAMHVDYIPKKKFDLSAIGDPNVLPWRDSMNSSPYDRRN
jgi:hypothetical protein